MVDYPGRFVWYELITTDMAAAQAFYGKVMGWGARDAAEPHLAYTLFTSDGAAACGLMGLPKGATDATPRWMGYVGVSDANADTDRIRRLGGAVYVPPTDTNIGRISVVADPQTANFALVEGLKVDQSSRAEPGKPGPVSWRELVSADREKAFDFYGELLGWEKAEGETDPADAYEVFSVGGQTAGGIYTQTAIDSVPFWLFYFNVSDIDAAVERVKNNGGQILDRPVELPGGIGIVRCRDPQGAAFGLEGKRGQGGVTWSSEWGGFSSRGKLINRASG
jgi:predicted enzyme related to lactoylglutathione lyase